MDTQTSQKLIFYILSRHLNSVCRLCFLYGCARENNGYNNQLLEFLSVLPLGFIRKVHIWKLWVLLYHPTAAIQMARKQEYSQQKKNKSLPKAAHKLCRHGIAQLDVVADAKNSVATPKRLWLHVTTHNAKTLWMSCLNHCLCSLGFYQ